MTDDLVAFLRARLDEDERDPGGWSPARVLAEVDAKRRILAEHPWRHEPDWPSGRQCRQCATEHPCTTLRLLALPYAGHPDYREEWRP